MQGQLEISSGNRPGVAAPGQPGFHTEITRMPTKAAADQKGWWEGTETYPGPVYLLLAQGQDTEAPGGDIQADPEGQRIRLIAREQ